MKIIHLPLIALATFACGCATEHYITDAKHPEIAIKEDGGVTYRGRYVEPEDLPGLLKRSGLTREDTINIHYPDTQTDFRTPSRVMTILLRNGFPRTVLVGDRKSYSHAGAERKNPPAHRQMETPSERKPPRIRYKK